MAVSPVFLVVYYVFWAGVFYGAYDSYSRHAFKTLLVFLVLIIWKLWCVMII